MKKKRWRVEYNTGDGVIEVIIRNSTGAKIDKFTANQADKRAHKIIGGILRDKYGVDLSGADFFSV